MKYFTFLLVVLFFLGCANQGNLVGGEKDETPPTLLSAIPSNETTGFTSKSFELFFDENIKLKDISKNLLVSPFLKEKPTIKVRPKSILVTIKEELQPNTTYSFNFGNAIQDLNEGNELAGFTYVFSTGEVMDSAVMHGFAMDAETGKIPETGAWALLYDSAEDSLFTTTAPSYATPIREDGSFTFQNVKDGRYQLFALRDNNFNYFYDLPDEQVAFVDSLVTINRHVELNTPLELFTTKVERGFIKKSVHDKYASLLVETSTEPREYEFDILDKQSVAKELIGGSVRYWFLDNYNTPDSTFVTLNGERIDTIKFRNKEFELKDSIFKVRVKNENPYSFQKEIKLFSKTPFSERMKTEAILLEDSLFVAGGINLIPDSLNPRQFVIDYPWDFGKSYILEFDDSTFTDIFNRPSDSIKVNFTIPKKEELSSLILSFSTLKYETEQLIIQLMKSNEVYYEEITNAKKLTINHLAPGKYKSRIIIDENKNGVWDTGDFKERKAPEKILDFETEIELTPNWELEVEVNLDE